MPLPHAPGQHRRPHRTSAGSTIQRSTNLPTRSAPSSSTPPRAAKGHLGSNLGAVELTLALHRVFDSPNDIILWDTGHQAYVHKLVTGRQRSAFDSLRQPGGLSGYPSRTESSHDWIENSHASTVLSYAHGLAWHSTSPVIPSARSSPSSVTAP